MKHVATARTARGRLIVQPRTMAATKAALLAWPDGPVTVTIERTKATRSALANAYYWGVVVKLMSDYTGSTPDEMHDVLKIKFLSKEIALARKNGTVVAEFVIGGSTAWLYPNEFYDYIERIRQWAFEELDVDIPPPDPEWLKTKQEEHPNEARDGRDGQAGRDQAGVRRGHRQAHRKAG